MTLCPDDVPKVPITATKGSRLNSAAACRLDCRHVYFCHCHHRIKRPFSFIAAGRDCVGQHLGRD